MFIKNRTGKDNKDFSSEGGVNLHPKVGFSPI
jgi:hypothetical protein